MSTVESALRIDALSAGYGRFDVIHDLTLSVEPGEAVGLLGPNGAGKTTVLMTIMGLLRHRRGRIMIDGVDITSMATHAIGRGYAALVPEGRRLFLNQTVEDNLRLGGMAYRHDRERVEALLRSVFDLFPIVEEYRGRAANALSGGEQQMVAIGRMMMSDTKVMLLDEPSLGLAPLAIADLTAGLSRLRAEGRSILLVEQRVDVALEVCDRISVLSGGRIVDEAKADEVDAEGRQLIDAYLG